MTGFLLFLSQILMYTHLWIGGFYSPSFSRSCALILWGDQPEGKVEQLPRVRQISGEAR